MTEADAARPRTADALLELIERRARQEIPDAARPGALAMAVADTVTVAFAVLSDLGLTEEAMAWMVNNAATANRLAAGEAVAVGRAPLDELVRVVRGYGDAAGRVEAEPLYGRDARVVGVEDGWSGAPCRWTWERLGERADSAVDALRADAPGLD